MANKIIQKLRTPRVKALSLHPTKPILVLALYDGTVMLYSTTDLKPISTFRISEFPVRTVAFYKHQMLFGCDDGNVYVYENTKLIQTIHAHNDFIRKIAVRGNNILTCSDDSSIKLWYYADPFQLVQVFDSHNHFVMDVSFIDDNQFLSASLDSTVKLWHVRGKKEMLTMAGHTDGVNSVISTDKYLFSVSDDLTTKIWDNYKCIYTIRGHSKNINRIKAFEGAILTCSEDGYVKMYNKKTWALENSINIGLERIWDVEKKDDRLFIACDEGLAVLSYGRESLQTIISGNKIFVCQNENLKVFKGDLTDKDLSFLDFVPQFVKTSGKLVALGYNNEYFIYNVLGFRYRTKGKGDDLFFLRAGYCVRDGSQVSFFDESHTLKKNLEVNGVKKMIGVRDEETLCVNMLKEDKTCLFMNGECVFTLESAYDSCVFYEDYVVFIGKDLLVYKFDYETMADLIDQGVACEEVNDHYTLLSRINKKVLSHFLSESILFFTSNSKLHYVALNEKVFDYQIGGVEGRFVGVMENEIFYFDKKLTKKPINMDFIRWQIGIVSGSGDLTVDENLLPRAVDFLIHLERLDDALTLTNDANVRFDLLLKLNRFDEAKRHCHTPQHFKTLMKIFIDKELYEEAAECALQAKDFTTLYALNAITGSYEDKIRNGCITRSLEFWNEFNTENYKKCAQMLSGTVFGDLFVESYLDVEP